jgi:hypothetical protein
MASGSVVTGPAPAGGFSYCWMNTNASVLLKTGAGMLNNVVINKQGSMSNVLTIYDGTSAASAQLIATIDPTFGLVTLFYNVAFQTGLYVVLGTGNAADITITFQ